MQLNNLKPTPNSRKDPYRAARGMAQGRGKQAGRGQSGQNKRTSVRPGFEGGQNPWYRRLPKIGFNNFVTRTTYEVISLAQLEAKFKSGATVDRESLVAAGLISRALPIKVLANGQLTKKLNVHVAAASAKAIAAIKAAGGQLIIEGEKAL